MYLVRILMLPVLILQICNAFHLNQSPDELTNFDAPRGYVSFGNSFYKYHRGPQTWAQARQICESEGGYLAIINSKNEADFLVGMMNKYPRHVLTDVIHKDYVLLGFQFKNGEFVTIDGKSLENSGYSHWAWRQPDNAGGNEYCGSLRRCGGLNDFSCETTSPFICEIYSTRPCCNESNPNQSNFDNQGNAKVDV